MKAKRRQSDALDATNDTGEGIVCTCGGDAGVLRTFRLHGCIRRQRKCDACGAKFYTVEAIEHEETAIVARLNAIIDNYETAAQRARELRDSLSAGAGAKSSAEIASNGGRQR